MVGLVESSCTRKQHWARYTKAEEPLTLEQLRRQRASLLETIRRIVSRFGPGLTDFSIRQSQDELLKASNLMADAIIKATQEMRDATPRQLLVRALRNLDPETARLLFTDALDKFRDSLLGSKAFQEVVEISFEGGTILAGGTLEAGVGLVPKFDPLSPVVANFIENHTAQLVVQVSSETRRAISGTIGRAFNVGPGAPRDVAKPIREILTADQQAGHMINTSGLTRRQARAVDRYLADLLRQGVPNAKAVARAERYAKRQLRYRAMNIARTEIMRAANAGHQALYGMALDQGLLNPVIHKKVWVTSADDRVCKICRPMDGQLVGIMQKWDVDFPLVNSIGRTEQRLHPPAHPQCRCTMAIQEVQPGFFPGLPI